MSPLIIRLIILPNSYYVALTLAFGQKYNNSVLKIKTLTDFPKANEVKPRYF